MLRLIQRNNKEPLGETCFAPIEALNLMLLCYNLRIREHLTGGNHRQQEHGRII